MTPAIRTPVAVADGLRMRYMGSKRAIAPRVAKLASTLLPNAPLVDLFAGLGSVAGAVAESGRPAWANDVQRYAGLAARCLLTSQDDPPDRARLERLVCRRYGQNVRPLRERFYRELRLERRAITARNRSAYLKGATAWRHAGNDEQIAREVAGLAECPRSQPYRLATLTFAWGYFGLEQAIELDSIRYALDECRAHDELSRDEYDWARLALLQTASRIASTPGHFAQYLRGDTEKSFERVARQRARSAWGSFLGDVGSVRPFGTAEWRTRNRVFGHDALQVWPHLDAVWKRPALFYADPPYSKEQYSRFYHVLETLERYDYPAVSSVGRYRGDRIQTPFSHLSGVIEAMRGLFAPIAARSGSLMLSYPSSGLLTRGLGVDVNALLGEYFDRVELALDVELDHSTLGARHGPSKTRVHESVWIATSC